MDDGRITMEVMTVNGRAVQVEFRIRLDTVEVVHLDKMAGVLDRDALRAWLQDPDEIMMTVDDIGLIDGPDAQLRILLPGVGAWPLSPAAERALRAEV